MVDKDIIDSAIDYFNQQKELGYPDRLYNIGQQENHTFSEYHREDADKHVVEMITEDLSKDSNGTASFPEESEEELHLDKKEEMKKLYFTSLKCIKCPLHETRTKVVFGGGDINAEVMFVGEAPGENEDLSGLPFVGKAGELLDKALNALGYNRKEKIFIANVIKCRPPGNRNPNDSEVLACMPILEKQITILKPKLIVALGRVAAENLLAETKSISKMRGERYYYNEIPTMVTYHPAALLRNAQYKRPFWEDLKRAREYIERAEA